jgi:hypothetical protein
MSMHFLSPRALPPLCAALTLLILILITTLTPVPLTPVLSLSATPSPTPSPTPQEEALLLDLRAVIQYQARLDWASDPSALAAMRPRLVELACGVAPGSLERLKGRVAKEVAAVGRVEERWRAAVARGERPSLGDYSDDLERERVLMTFEVLEGARAECPFWRTPTADDLGVHRDAGRLQLVLETMGSAQLVLRGAGGSVGGAGQGRALAVWGASLGAGFGAGLEVGAASTFPKDERGQRSVKAMWAAGVPLLARWWVGNLRLDTELALVARLPDGALSDALVGYRVAQGVGVSTLRVAGLLPHVMVWAGYESYYGADPAQVIRVGTRVGVSWGGGD